MTKSSGNNPTTDALLNRGVAHDEKGERALAIADFDKILMTNGDNVLALNARAWAYGQMGKLDKALVDADRAVALRTLEALDVSATLIVSSRFFG